MKLIALVFVFVCFASVFGRNIHPGYETTWEDIENGDVIPMNVLFNVKLNRFVPVNNPLFFKFSEPCQNGFKRDARGICRDVWD
ncbi:unnamed protein product [Colias eurytheme]|nr:unnamed protein product [Colias eurytheme]